MQREFELKWIHESFGGVQAGARTAQLLLERRRLAACRAARRPPPRPIGRRRRARARCRHARRGSRSPAPSVGDAAVAGGGDGSPPRGGGGDRPRRRGLYEVATLTSALPGAGTDAGVSVVLHGAGGVSPELALANHPDNFAAGRYDTFVVDAGQVGARRGGPRGAGVGGVGLGEVGSGFGLGLGVGLEGAAARGPVDGGGFAAAPRRGTALATPGGRRAGPGRGWGPGGWVLPRLAPACARPCASRVRQPAPPCRAQDLGPLVRVRIGHDGAGSRPRWHLHHATVARLGSQEPRALFPCGGFRPACAG